MKQKKNKEEDTNFIGASPENFVKYYNENIPASFPRATLRILKKFQQFHPALFKKDGEWIINKHRKKLMDWLSSYREEK